jgi:lysophospholipase L1-like esterase
MRRDRSARVIRLAVGIAAILTSAGACGSIGSARTYPPGTSDISIAPVATATPTPGPSVTIDIPSLPPGPLTVVAIGDSLTEGQGDDSGQGGYPGRLARLVEEVRPGSKVANVGHSGWTSKDLIEGTGGQPSELAQALDAQPDIALVWIGSNDLWYLYEFGPEPMTAGAEEADLTSFAGNLDTILGRLTDQGAVVVVALLDDQSKRPVVAHPPNPAEPALPATTAADLALMSRHVAAYDDIIRSKAAEYGAITVDFYGSTLFTDAATLSGDGNHPNPAGYDLVARVWWAALAPMLGQAES